ncbi:cadherin-related family member 3 [Alligator mississippiensis]|uniref:cadherin-related family member 3 n=1 Tax=Alligator mississippiensis TaxID=8496 RepID=UPI00287807EE|nr:cadherin-related family member 3 [Alligator mississippiensis]
MLLTTHRSNSTFLFKFAGGSTLSLENLPATGNITENSPANALVYVFSVKLSPSCAEVAEGYPIIINSNPLTDAFQIVPESKLVYRVVTTENPILDYETMPHLFDLQIYVMDTAEATDLQTLTVKIEDVNEPPMIQGNMATQPIMIYILEGSGAGNIYQIEAIDPERKELKPAPELDPEGFKLFFFGADIGLYFLNITATDNLGLKTTGTVIVNIININDEAPYFTILAADIVSTFSVGSFKNAALTAVAAAFFAGSFNSATLAAAAAVANAAATTSPVGLAGFFSSLAADIVSTFSAGSFKNAALTAVAAAFFAGSFNGATLAGAAAVAAAAATTSPVGLASRTSPLLTFFFYCRKQISYTIPEEQRPGTIVVHITAKDPDDEGFISRLTYSISPPNEYFSINPLTGVIQVAKRIDREASTFQLHPRISLIIHVEDSPRGGQMNETEITIIIEDINDNPPECKQYTFSSKIPETATPGTLLFALRDYCYDNDVEPPNNKFNFTGLSGLGSNIFTLDPVGSGIVVVTRDLNFENPANQAMKDEYSLTVVVQDIAWPNYANNIYIYIKILPVNEFFPVFDNSSYVFNVPEITPATSKIGKVSATDKDLPFAGITYSIVGGGGTFGYTNIFWIDPEKGDMKIIATLDYETTQRYILTVQASDSEKTATVSVTVNVLEVNDEKPVCTPNSYSLAVPVDLAVGTNIEGFSILCHDPDSSPRSFRYFISSGNINNHFTFSPSAGSNSSRLILASRFDYENGLDTTWAYSLRIYITDDNLLSGSDRATVHVETGTVTLSIKVIPNPTTLLPTTVSPGFTLLIRRENTFSASAWYVPFVICLGSMLLLGVLGYLTFLLAKCIRTHCPPKPKADKHML